MPLTTLAAVALLAYVLAYWTWVWFAPSPQPRAQPLADAPVSVSAATDFFGRAQRTANTAAPTGIAMKLLGVAASSGKGRGYAVLQLEPRNIVSVREGDEVAPGVRLAEVLPDHVTLERNGVREMLAWPERAARVAQAPAPPTAPTPVRQTSD